MAHRKSTIKKKKHPKLPNGFGRITEIKNKNLRKPYRAMITVGKSDEGAPLGKILGYYPTWEAAYIALDEYHKNPYELKKQTLTVQELYNKWSQQYFQELKSDSAARTTESSWSYVTPDFRRLNAATITPVAIKEQILNDAYRIDEKGKKLLPSENTKSKMKSMFNLMYDYAVLGNLVAVNPARQFVLKGIYKKIEKQREEKIPFPQEHVQALWNNIEFGYTRMILINVYSGWRPQEMVLLKKSDIDWDKLTMTGGMKTDAGERRTIPIHSSIVDLVRYYYELSSGEMLFYDYDQPKPRKMTYDKYRGRFNKAMAYHGWGCYTPSCPRHTFASMAQDVKIEEYAKKLIMGHEIEDVTLKHYTHIDIQKYLKEEIEKIKGGN